MLTKSQWPTQQIHHNGMCWRLQGSGVSCDFIASNALRGQYKDYVYELLLWMEKEEWIAHTPQPHGINFKLINIIQSRVPVQAAESIFHNLCAYNYQYQQITLIYLKLAIYHPD